MQVFKVNGMGCGSCVSKITRALLQDDGQAQVAVDLATGTVTVESSLTAAEIREQIEGLGFEVAPQA
ncbi:heavy-metal-associated domain-containing protein [Chitinimonas naiadis]